jgi:hypothetical protein
MSQRGKELAERLRIESEDDIGFVAYWWLDCLQRDLWAQGYSRSWRNGAHPIHRPFDAIRQAISDATEAELEAERAEET